MTRYRYNTATTLDGFLADDADSLDWLFKQDIDEDGLLSMGAFMPQVGVLVMGATTYQWVVDHETGEGRPWPYELPTVVFTHRDLEPAAANVHLVAGTPQEHRPLLERLAAGKDVWVVGGGDLAADFATAGMLDEVIVGIAPVTLGSGRRLLGGAFDLSLAECGRNGDFVVARYDVVGLLGAR